MGSEEIVTAHFVVGDVHGMYEPLLHLESEIQKYCEQESLNPHYVLVGDLLDRGPQSREVVQHVRNGLLQGTHSCLAGNHESIFMELVLFYCANSLGFLEERCRYITPLREQFAMSGDSMHDSIDAFVELRRKMWLINGGGSTLLSFGQGEEGESWNFEEYEEDLAFLASLDLVYRHKTFSVSHALASADAILWAEHLQNPRVRQGHLSGGDQLATQRQESAEASDCSRESFLNDLLWSREASSPWSLPGVHISGHTPLQSVTSLEEGKRIQIDTGCVYGNRLTAYCPERGHFLSAMCSG